MSHKYFLHGLKLSLSLTVIMLLSACQNAALVEQYTDTHPHTGFLSDYTKLKLSDGIDGEQVLRWSKPTFPQAEFKTLMLDPVTLETGNIQHDEISKESLQEIQQYFNQQLKEALSSKYTLTNKPSPNTAQIKIAITGIQLEQEGMKVTEILPYGAAIGLLRAVTNMRNREVTVLLEMEIQNSQTHEPMLLLLRVGEGENVRMLWGPNFELKHVKGLLDSWGALASSSFQKLLN